MSERTKAEIWSDWRCKKDVIHLAHDIDMDRIEKIAGLLDEITELRAELSRERERHQELRKSVLMEALKAVENERLDFHEEYLSVRDPDCAEDAAYSRAIRDAEIAIELLLEPQPAPVEELPR